MLDGRIVRLIGGRDVQLQDGASMSRADADKAIADCKTEIEANLKEDENVEMYRWKLDDKLKEVMEQCPDLFDEYFEQAQKAAAALATE